MHDRFYPKGMCSGSRELFKFWKISDNISETVQDRNQFCIQLGYVKSALTDYKPLLKEAWSG